MEGTLAAATSASPNCFYTIRGRGWKPLLLLVILGWILGPNVASVWGQATDPLDSIVVPTFPTTIPVEMGYINPANGNLHLEIPLGSFTERGGHQVKFSYNYDSGFWYPNGHGAGSLWGGAPYPLAQLISTSNRHGSVDYVQQDQGTPCSLDGIYKYSYYNNWVYVDANGGVHSFPIRTVQGWVSLCGDWTSMNQPNGDSIASDASGYHMYVTSFTSAAVYAPDGTLVVGGTEYNLDSNGNYESANGDAYGSWLTIDDLGRSLVTATNSGNVYTYHVLNETGGTSTYIITIAPMNVCTNFVGSGSPTHDYCGGSSAVQSIQLPDGTSYSFTYDSGTGSGHYGQMLSMTLPTGATIHYTYSNFADSMYYYGTHITRGITSRTTPDGTWTYKTAVVSK